MNTDLTKLTVSSLAEMIRQDWKKPYFAAVPYINAMLRIPSITVKGEMFFHDDVESVLRYFISNSSTWRGDVAKAVKAELKRRVGIK